VSNEHDQDQAADPLEVIRRHTRAIVLALRAIDMAYPGTETITHRMRGTIDALHVDLGELKFFMPKRTED
jgi:hypothetical protein